MRVHIATDHAGFELKEKIIAHLSEAGHDVVDHGAFAYDTVCAKGGSWTARLAREHNDANMMAVGARQHSEDEAIALIDAFLETPFSGDERHQRRIDLMKDYERSARA